MRGFVKHRFTRMAVLVALVLSLETPAIVGAQDIQDGEHVQIYIQQEKAVWDQQPYIDQGNTMVPMRSLFEKLGFKVTWDENKRAAMAQKGDLRISLAINKTTASVNDIQYYLDVPPVIRDGSTYMPLRFVSEAAGADVLWDGTTRTVSIQTDGDAQQKIHRLIENVAHSSSFLQRAVTITSADGIKSNETEVKSITMNSNSSSAEVTFTSGFTVSKAVKTEHGVTISPAESVVYEFTCEVYKDGSGQWVLRSNAASLPYVLQEKKPFMEAS